MSTASSKVPLDRLFSSEYLPRLNRMLYGMAKKLIWDPSQREDVVQKVKAIVVRNYKKIKDEPDGAFKYAAGVMRKVASRHNMKEILRTDKFVNVQLDDGAGHSDLVEYIAEYHDQGIDEYENREWLTRAISQLDPTAALVIDLHLQGNSNHKISQVLNMPKGTVGSHLSRCREQLRNLINEDGLDIDSFFHR